jgi:hypothetical protein
MFICSKCAKECDYPKARRHSFCKECKAKERLDLFEKTIIERYGSRENFLKERQKRQREKCLEKFGVENTFQRPECIEKKKKTQLEKYGDEWFTNREKFKETINKKPLSKNRIHQIAHQKYYEETTPEERLKIKTEKFRKTLFQNYGPGLKGLQEKSSKTCLEKYGVKNPFQIKGINQKIEETKLKKYGDRYYNNREKSAKTCLEKYGVSKVHSMTPKYIINEKKFDSSWEVAYFLWLEDQHIDFIYKPKEIEYQGSDGKIHHYYPDFYTDHYIEIKGDHLYRNGVLTSPSGKKLFLEKTQCYKENNVEIITSSKLKPIMEWVEEKYGKNYISSFKIKFQKKIITDYFVYGNRDTSKKLSSELKKINLKLQKVYSYEDLKKKSKIIFLSQGGTGMHVEEMISLGAIIIGPIAEWNKRSVIQNDYFQTIEQVIDLLSKQYRGGGNNNGNC